MQENQALKLPNRFEIFHELQKRKGLSAQDQEEYIRLKAGVEGECTVQEYVKEYGEKQWQYFTNTWLDYYGAFEIDFMLITKHQVYLFEVKNYSGKYVFQNGQCVSNGLKVGHHAINQARKSTTHFQNFLTHHRINVTVTGALLFTGIDCEVTLHDDVSDLEIIKRHQLKNYIQHIRETERRKNKNMLDTKPLFQLLEENKIANPFMPKVLSDEMMKQVQTGVMCASCCSFDVDTASSYVRCACGLEEPREQAIVRTICEYGVIRFDKHLATKEVLLFFGKDYSAGTINKYLKKHFKQIRKGRNSLYENLCQPYSSVKKGFDLKLPSRFTFYG